VSSYQPHHTATLVDILDRVLDKGLVVAGDIRISLANVELLTIRIRLLVCSIDKAEQIGLNWWRYDQSLAHGVPAAGALADAAPETETIARLEARIAQLEGELERRGAAVPPAAAPQPGTARAARTRRRPQ
jgi:hypothetical protein